MTDENNEQYYNRQKLYAEVWEHTLIMLCKQYGVTHSELVNACKKLNVPRPAVGYWTQKDLGKAPLPFELPLFDNPPRLLIHPPKAEKKAKPLPVKKVVLRKPEEKPKAVNKKRI